MRNISLLDHPLHTDSSPFQGNQFYFVLITWTCVSLNNYSHPLPFIGAYSLVHVVICSSSTSALVGTWHLSSHSTSMSLFLSPLMHSCLLILFHPISPNGYSSNEEFWIKDKRLYWATSTAPKQNPMNHIHANTINYCQNSKRHSGMTFLGIKMERKLLQSGRSCTTDWTGRWNVYSCPLWLLAGDEEEWKDGALNTHQLRNWISRHSGHS